MKSRSLNREAEAEEEAHHQDHADVGSHLPAGARLKMSRSEPQPSRLFATATNNVLLLVPTPRA